MKVYAYVLQPNFFSYLSKHCDLLAQLHDMDEAQRMKLICMLDEKELWQRAVSYFNDEHMELREHTIYYTHSLKKTIYTMEVETERIILKECDDNPFIPFLYRVFRTLLICDEKERVVKKEKVL